MSGRLVIAGVASGVGKTTIVMALCAAWRARGLAVQPFKAGPDYIDPSYHRQAAGRVSRNLDSFLLEPPVLRALFTGAAARADLALVEGMMGLYDGRDGTTETGSTAEVAKLIAAPVVVVLDVSAQSRTAGAVALGCIRYDPALRIAGFILNRVGSETHARWASTAVEAATGLPVLGAVPRDATLRLPERHLGLVPMAEHALPDHYLERLVALAERHVALDRLREIADGAAVVADDATPLGERRPPFTRIAIARDAAFNFYYEDSLELLERAGAELVPFSPLADPGLPDGISGLYVGGGFPELHARELSMNQAMRSSISVAAARGVRIVAECGGLMYLARALTDPAGTRHEMVGLVPVETAMRTERLTLGYRTATARRSNPLLERGETVRAHEFHYSELAGAVDDGHVAFEVAERPGVGSGYATGRLLASYLHLHLGSKPEMAARFVDRSASSRPDG